MPHSPDEVRRVEDRIAGIKARLDRHFKTARERLALAAELGRLEHLLGLLAGEKCRGCTKTVARDDMADAGEDPRGRPIRLCRDCRKIVGKE